MRTTAFAWRRTLGIVSTCVMASLLGSVGLGPKAYAASASAQASATVIAPVVIATAGTARVSPSPANMTSVFVQGVGGMSGGMGGGGVSTSSAAESTLASVTISSDGNQSYAVSVPSSVVATASGGEQSISVATAVSSKQAAGALSQTTETVLIGGMLMASLSPSSGSYAGDVRVTIEYN